MTRAEQNESFFNNFEASLEEAEEKAILHEEGCDGIFTYLWPDDSVSVFCWYDKEIQTYGML